MTIESILKTYDLYTECEEHIPQAQKSFTRDNVAGIIFLATYKEAARKGPDEERAREVMEYLLEMMHPSNYREMKKLYDSLDL